MNLPRPWLAIGSTVLLALTLAGAAQAQGNARSPAPERSEDRVIRYHNAAPRSEGPVREAVRAWHRANVGIRFVEVRPRAANVVIRHAPRRWRCSGRAEIQGRRGPGKRDVRIRYGIGPRAEVLLGENCPLTVRALVATHELGHVMGLNHDTRRCSIMAPTVDVVNGAADRNPRCSPARWERVRRNLLAAADISDARRLYGNLPGLGRQTPASDDHSDPFLDSIGWAMVIGVGILFVGGLVLQLRR